MKVKVSIDPNKLKNHHIIAVNILRGKIDLFSLPRQMRITQPAYYLYCFRRVKGVNNPSLYSAILDLLKSDIGYIIEPCKKFFFEDLFDLEVSNYVSIYQKHGFEIIDDDKKEPEIILRI